MQVSNAPAGGAAAETGSYTCDASGRMLSGRDDKLDSKFDEVVSALTYDGFGNRLSESRSGNTSAGGPNPSTTSYTYDANNRVVSSSAGELWVYDANGNTTSQTSRDGSTSSTAFNAENRSTTSSSTSEGKTTTSSSTYDAAGNVTRSRVDGDGFGFTEVTQRDRDTELMHCFPSYSSQARHKPHNPTPRQHKEHPHDLASAGSTAQCTGRIPFLAPRRSAAVLGRYTGAANFPLRRGIGPHRKLGHAVRAGLHRTSALERPAEWPGDRDAQRNLPCSAMGRRIAAAVACAV